MRNNLLIHNMGLGNMSYDYECMNEKALSLFPSLLLNKQWAYLDAIVSKLVAFTSEVSFRWQFFQAYCFFSSLLLQVNSTVHYWKMKGKFRVAKLSDSTAENLLNDPAKYHNSRIPDICPWLEYKKGADLSKKLKLSLISFLFLLKIAIFSLFCFFALLENFAMHKTEWSWAFIKLELQRNSIFVEIERNFRLFFGELETILAHPKRRRAIMPQ